MTIITRFKKLNIWNKICVISAVCGIFSFLGWFLWPESSEDISVRVDVKDSPHAPMCKPQSKALAQLRSTPTKSPSMSLRNSNANSR